MKFIKPKIKLIIAIIIGMLIGGVTVYAAYNYFANEVLYTKLDGTEISVEDALNELYNSKNKIEYGKIELTLEINKWKRETIQFEKEYAETPKIFYKYDAGDNGGSICIVEINKTGFTLAYNVFGNFPYKTCHIDWIAIGK